MVERGLVDMDDVRILWTSELIPSGPLVVRKDLPEEAKDIYRELVLDFADRDPTCFEKIMGNYAVDFAPITHDQYETLIDIRRNGLNGAGR
jgi:phosphonate transport system substrate-binding protein